MQAENRVAADSKKMLWAGRIISALPVLVLLASGAAKLIKPAGVMKEFDRLGYSPTVAFRLGFVEIACALIYAFPRTSVIGAILMTGYLGGATATHVRVGDPFFFPPLIGVLVWLGLFLRDGRLRALLPLRSKPTDVVPPIRGER